MQATLWVLLTFLGLGLLGIMSHIKQATLQAITVRAAACSFVGAGTIGAAGWIGAFIAAIVAWVNGVGSEFGREAIGTGALWILWLGMSFMWILTMLPESWFGKDIPDALSVSGLFLPGLSASIPGQVGDFFTNLFGAIGDVMVTAVSHLIGAA